MDTNINVNKMQSKQIRGIVRELVSEILKEDMNALVTTKKGTTKNITVKNASELDPLKRDTNITDIETTSGSNIKEMARIAKGYRLVDPEMDSTQFANQRISGVSIADILEYFRENPGAEKSTIQTHFNFVRPQIPNAIINSLVDTGILVRTDVEVGTTPGEEIEPDYAIDAEDFFIGGRLSNRSTMPFGRGETETDAEEEPSIPELPTDNPVTRANISDEDYQAWMKYSDYVERLARTKAAITQFKKQNRGGDDLSSDSGDVSRLFALKTSLESRINDLVSSNEYVKNKSMQSKPDEEEINETVIKRLKKLANI